MNVEPKPIYHFLKRVLDIVVGALVLGCLGPVLFIIGLCIRLYDRGPALYRAPRIGRGGRPFTMFKFRTMVVQADQIGASSTADGDPRVTAFGRFLRRYKIDEFPQFINVLNGTMSLVGPRPQIKWAVDLYTPRQRQVLSVLPGITDYASLYFSNLGGILKGSSDPDGDYMKNVHPIKMQLSLRYVRERSLAIDLKILFLTALTIVGAYHPVLPKDLENI